MSTDKYSNGGSKAQGKARSAKLQRLDNWFSGRRYVPIVCAAKCPLKLNERRVYSYLVFRLRRGQTATKRHIIKALTLGDHTVNRILNKLVACGLAAKDGRAISALEPKVHWFAWKRQDGEWFTRLATYREYRRTTGAPISEIANGLWALLYSLAKADRFSESPTLTCQTKTGLAKLLGCSVRQVGRSMTWLHDQGLIRCCGHTTVLRPPSSEQLGWWERRPERPARPTQEADITMVQIRGQGQTTDAINREIAKWTGRMIEAGYTPRQVVDYWQHEVIGKIANNVHDTLFSMLVQSDHFGDVFGEVEGVHSAHGKAVSSIGLLRARTPSMIEQAAREARLLSA